MSDTTAQMGSDRTRVRFNWPPTWPCASAWALRVQADCSESGKQGLGALAVAYSGCAGFGFGG